MGERKHTHAHKRTHTGTHILTYRGGSNKPYLKRGKKDKRRIRTKSIQWKNLKRGHNAFTSKFKKNFSSGKEGQGMRVRS